MDKTIDNIIFHQGIPTESELKEFASDDRFRLVVLDDLMHECVKNPAVQMLFVSFAHHLKLGTLILYQNLLCQGQNARSITLNVNYIILFKNLRDVNQIATLGRQLYPGKFKEFVEVYKDAVTPLYGYLVVDIHSHTDDKYRLRTHIFSGEDPIVYSI